MENWDETFAAIDVLLAGMPDAEANGPIVELTREVAHAYRALGTSARDRKAARPRQTTTTRPVAPPVAPERFATHIVVTLGEGGRVLSVLGRMLALPEPMRVLALESMFGAADRNELLDVLAQVECMLA